MTFCLFLILLRSNVCPSVRKIESRNIFRKCRTLRKSLKDEKQKVTRKKCRLSRTNFCATFYERDILCVQGIYIPLSDGNCYVPLVKAYATT